ncbi:hypothetical protein QEN19_003146 [Hanseniaspora menglaensis]
MLRNTILKRSYTNVPLTGAPKVTKVNNITVVTKPTISKVNDVSFVYGAGSTAENYYNNGLSQVLSKAFVGNTASDAFTNGFKLSSSVGREFQTFTASGLDSSKALSLVKDAVLSEGALLKNFDTYKQAVAEHLVKYENTDFASIVHEHLHATAFQNTPLSVPTTGTVETVSGLKSSDASEFLARSFGSKNLTIVQQGSAVDHEKFVELVSKINVPASAELSPIAPSEFIGSEVRLRDDTLPKAWWSVAVEGESVTSPNYYVAKVAANVFGSFNLTEPASRKQGSKLVNDVLEYEIVDSFSHFSNSYKNTGLWGFAAESTNIANIDEFTHFALKQWNRLTVSVTELEVARAKQALKLEIASNESIETLAGSIAAGAPVLALEEQFALIDKITASDVKNWASEKVWDQDVAVAGTGQIEGLFDYVKIRNDMSMMRW